MPSLKVLDQAELAIQRGESSRALNLLLEKTQELDIHNELLLLSSRFANLLLERRKGLILFKDFTEEMNTANMALIGIIDSLKEQQSDSSEAELGKQDLTDINMLRSSVPDAAYYGFVIVGLCAAFGLFAYFSYSYDLWYHTETPSLSELLYVSTFAWAGFAFLIGGIDGLNRRSGKMVDWRIIGPFLGLAVLSTIAASLMKVMG